MTYEKIERDEYEMSVAEYLRPAVADEECIDVHITHTPAGDAPGDLKIFVGSVDAPFDLAGRQPIESKALDDDSTLNIYEMPDGVEALVIHHPPQSPPISVSFFSIELHDWPTVGSVEEDLGPRFKKALRLLLEACLEARGADEERESVFFERVEACERRRKDEKREAETGEEIAGAEANPARNQSPREEAENA